MLDTPLGRLRLVGLLEGASFLLLLGVAMPLKYLAGMPEAVRVVGLVHGVLFMLFVLVLAQTAGALGWRPRKVVVAFVAAVLPFGPFVLDSRLRREAEAAEPSGRALA